MSVKDSNLTAAVGETYAPEQEESYEHQDIKHKKDTSHAPRWYISPHLFLGPFPALPRLPPPPLQQVPLRREGPLLLLHGPDHGRVRRQGSLQVR